MSVVPTNPPLDAYALVASLSAGGYEDIYDEVSPNGRLKPVYNGFMTALGSHASAQEMEARQQALSKTILNNGITYNVYADAKSGPSRPWSLDLLPLIITPEEWQKISVGVEERARLLNLMMADIYGDQRLLKEGLVPPALIYGDAGYLRPMKGYKPPRDIWLHLPALDMGRSADGRWWVVNHRTQAPSGLGYVLENRLTVSRSFPEAFRSLKVQHIATFYKQWMESVRQL
ncbi:MAG: circularly permuted type 2 ATP-grasp protein, partial [Burkholderiales bacterium]|nr:circularly permuted type 2 ATP-grasp protein [Burkholderiales bacterium]